MKKTKFTAQDSFPTYSSKLPYTSKVRVGSEVIIENETGAWYVKVPQNLVVDIPSGQGA